MVRNERGNRIPVRRGGLDPKRADELEAAAQADADVVEQVDADTRASQEVASAGSAAGASDVAQEAVDWREAALRLKAEMENYRKRQKRWAEDELVREQEQFLRPFLAVVDNLEQALKHIDLKDPAHRGVRLVYDEMVSLLLKQGVERIAAEGQLFDPQVHEAVAVIPAHEAGVEDMHVVSVTLPGYTYAIKGAGPERVLRPAKVIVAKQGA